MAQTKHDCIICVESKRLACFPTIKHPGDTTSQHVHNVCIDCWQQHLEVQIHNKAKGAIICAQCTQTLEETEIKRLASPIAFET